MRKCVHPNCWHLFKDSMYESFCSEYCFLTKDIKVSNKKWPVLQRKCNWCHKEYEYRHDGRRKDSFCGHDCSHAAQGIRKYYALINILRVFPEGLTAKQITRYGELHGCPLSSNKVSMRIRSMSPYNVIHNQEVTTNKGIIKIYYLNPEIRGLPFKESLKKLDTLRKTARRDKIRVKKANLK